MGNSPPPPNGYLNRKVAQSVQEAVATQTPDHIKTIVKSAIQRYIESFMSQQGGNRSLYESFTKLGLQYITDQSFEQNSDPTLRKTQLARLFEQVRQQLPAILIVDSSFEYVPANFTGLDGVRIQNGYWYGTVQVVRNLVISVVGATRDQSSTDFLHGMLSILFGEMRWLAGGTRITGNSEQGESWVLTMGIPRLGNVNQARVTDDPKDTIWSFAIEIPDILFEDHVVVKQEINRVEPGSAIMNPSETVGLINPTIFAPDTIAINDSFKVLFDYLQPDFHKIVISDPNIATIDPNTRIISPRKLGSFEIQVLRYKVDAQPELFNQQNGNTMDIVARKKIKVTPN